MDIKMAIYHIASKNALAILLTLFSTSVSAQWTELQLPTTSAIATTNGVSSFFNYTYVWGQGGIYRSTNGGASWNTETLDSEDITGLFQIGKNLWTWGSGGYPAFGSSDSGTTWFSADTSFPNSSILGLGYVSNGDFLFRIDTTHQTISRSSDNGSTWQEVSTGLSGYMNGLLVFNKSLVATTGNGVFRSTNDGLLWNASGLQGHDVNDYDPWAYLIDSDFVFNSGRLYAVTDVGAQCGPLPCYTAHIFRSDDSGASWISLDTGLPQSHLIRSFAIAGSDIFIVDQTDSSHPKGSPGYDQLFRSTDYGLNWVALTTPLPEDSWFPYAHIVSSASTLIGTGPGSYWGFTSNSEVTNNSNNRGVVRSTDGGETWNQCNSGLPTFQYPANVSQIGASTSVLFAVSGINYYPPALLQSENNGSSWATTGNRLHYRTLISAPALVNSDLFVSTDSGLFISTNSGSSWSDVSLGSHMGTIANDPLEVSGSTLFVTTDSGIFSTANEGSSWTSLGNPNGAFIGEFGSYLFASGKNLYRSTNSGSTWDSVNAGGLGPISSMGPNLVAGGSGAYISTDNGASWIQLQSGLPTGLKIVAFQKNNGKIFAATASDGVFGSRDSGWTWYDANYGLTSGYTMSSLATDGTYLYANTTSGTLWRRPLSQFLLIEPEAVTQTPPVSNSLRSYPNPFSQSTEIAFTSAAAGYADVSVVNILGAPVAHLFSGELSAGEHDFAWDAQGMAPGSYWCIVRMGDSVERIALSVQR